MNSLFNSRLRGLSSSLLRSKGLPILPLSFEKILTGSFSQKCSFSSSFEQQSNNNSLSTIPNIVTIGNNVKVEIPSNLSIIDPSVFIPPEINKWDKVENQFLLLNVPSFIEVKSLLPSGSSSPGDRTPLLKTIFEQPIRQDIVHELIRFIRNKRRQPKKTKRIGEIRGSNKKPIPQKKMGRSQVGNKRNSSWRGGMKAHGPVIRDYSIGMNKKARALGMMITLAARYREGNLIIFDKLATPVSAVCGVSLSFPCFSFAFLSFTLSLSLLVFSLFLFFRC
jgi:hypothetical protein